MNGTIINPEVGPYPYKQGISVKGAIDSLIDQVNQYE